ncbi:MAG: hypothetical protein N3B10_06705 [Armatimonadetes bacterium]|nr:hypothetical protein [Armatimonadota bacterium]MCX7968165.1 hypothetical protein [Armatimonadota bacterium]MDW8144349.1 transposase [Armatimonadota bacterium]
MGRLDYKPFYRRNLPHIQPLGATFFVTFRLAGSLPFILLQQREQEKRFYQAILARTEDENERRRLQRKWERRWFLRFEKALDKADFGPAWLKDERIAELVAESILYRDGKVYRLDAYCIMPNHVHLVFAPLVSQSVRLSEEEQSDRLPYSLARILHSLKGYTAWRANRILNRKGAFWEHESYDHYVRNEREWEQIITYVLNNPVKAGFVSEWQDWKWSYFRYAEQL